MFLGGFDTVRHLDGSRIEFVPCEIMSDGYTLAHTGYCKRAEELAAAEYYLREHYHDIALSTRIRILDAEIQRKAARSWITKIRQALFGPSSIELVRAANDELAIAQTGIEAYVDVLLQVRRHFQRAELEVELHLDPSSNKASALEYLNTIIGDERLEPSLDGYA